MFYVEIDEYGRRSEYRVMSADSWYSRSLHQGIPRPVGWGYFNTPDEAQGAVQAFNPAWKIKISSKLRRMGKTEEEIEKVLEQVQSWIPE